MLFSFYAAFLNILYKQFLNVHGKDIHFIIFKERFKNSKKININQRWTNTFTWKHKKCIITNVYLRDFYLRKSKKGHALDIIVAKYLWRGKE